MRVIRLWNTNYSCRKSLKGHLPSHASPTAGCGRTISTSGPDPAPDGVEAQIERITRYGFDARIALVSADGEPLLVQVTRDRLEELELERGQIVWVIVQNDRAFAETV